MQTPCNLERRLATLSRLPSLPATAVRVLELARDPDASMPQLAQVIKTDPALAARVLRAANSAQFSRGRQCDNLRQALVTLGMDTTLTITLGFSVVNALRAEQKGEMDYTGFWKRSLLSAIAARSLADFVSDVDRDNLFLAGLLQDIGMLAINQLEPGFYLRIAPGAPDHQALTELELQTLGATHADAGAWLLRHWGMPDYLPAVVAASHSLERAAHQGDFAPTSACVAVSGCIADIWSAPDRDAMLPRLSTLLTELTGIDPAEVGVLLIRIRERVPETETLFNMPLLDEEQMQAVLDEAAEMVMQDNLAALRKAGGMVDEAVVTALHQETATTSADADATRRLLLDAGEALSPHRGTARPEET